MGTVVENISSLKTVKADIKAAIEDKGVDMSNVPFTGYAQKINEISIGSGDYETGFENGVAAQKAKLTGITITDNGTYSREDGYNEVIVEVPIPTFATETLDVTLNYNGTYNYTPTTDGYSSVEVTVDVIPEPVMTFPLDVTLTENGTYNYDPTDYGDGYSSVKVTVDVSGGTTGSLALVDGTKLGYSTFTEIPDYYDFSNITDMYYMFNQCYYLQNIPLIDTSNVTNMFGMFEHCTSLISIPQLDTSNVTNMRQMFYDCRSLQTIPQLDTSNVTDMNNMFLECINLISIPELNTSNVTNMSGMFGYCTKLTTIPELDTRKVTSMEYMFYYETGIQTLISLPKIYCDSCNNMKFYFGPALIPYLTDVGGWINLNINWSDGYGLAKCPNLTYQSCINILNGLADVTELGSRTLKVHSNFLTTVGDEISIGTNKGWTITA